MNDESEHFRCRNKQSSPVNYLHKRNFCRNNDKYVCDPIAHALVSRVTLDNFLMQMFWDNNRIAMFFHHEFSYVYTMLRVTINIYYTLDICSFEYLRCNLI